METKVAINFKYDTKKIDNDLREQISDQQKTIRHLNL